MYAIRSYYGSFIAFTRYSLKDRTQLIIYFESDMPSPSRSSKSSSLFGELTLSADPGLNLGDNRIRLLELIDELGSLSQAAKAVPMSYRAAWDALNEMNNLASEPLVIRVTGGKNGGGTQLTPYGKQTIALYRAIQSEYDDMRNNFV